MSSYDVEDLRVYGILKAAEDHVKEFGRTEHSVKFERAECMMIAHRLILFEDFNPPILELEMEVYEILNTLYWEFGGFCQYMTSNYADASKNNVLFCPLHGNLYPRTSQYMRSCDSIASQFAIHLQFYDLLRDVFTFTWIKHFGKESKIAQHRKIDPSAASGCSACIEMDNELNELLDVFHDDVE